MSTVYAYVRVSSTDQNEERQMIPSYQMTWKLIFIKDLPDLITHRKIPVRMHYVFLEKSNSFSSIRQTHLLRLRYKV